MKPAAPARTSPKPLPYTLSICAKHELACFADHQITHLLSLEDPMTPKESPAWLQGEHVQLWCDDVESSSDALRMSASPPTPSLVAEILEFGERCLAAARCAPVSILVHCFAGVSRSTAAGFALLAQALGPGQAVEALRYVRLIRPVAIPNRLIVRYADHLLHRKGELVRALERIYD